MRKQRVVLEDHADVALPRRNGGDVVLADTHGAGARAEQAGDDPQDRRLAAAARPQDRGDRSRGHLEADVLDDDGAGIGVADAGDREALSESRRRNSRFISAAIDMVRHPNIWERMRRRSAGTAVFVCFPIYEMLLAKPVPTVGENSEGRA